MAEIKNCPFCGAVVSFDNHLCNREAGGRHKIKCWNRRSDNGTKKQETV